MKLGAGLSHVGISGASGLVGRALVHTLRSRGVRITTLVRDRARAGDGRVFWSPEGGVLDARGLEGVDAFVHLAGENVGEGRWTDERRRRIRESRTLGTSIVASSLAALGMKPKILVSASAIGIYGADRGEEELDEAASLGTGFLADVCKAWEAATKPAEDAGIRTVHARIGIVLARDGGALAKMLLPFRMGVGGRLGNGRQWMSWVALEDVVGAIVHALETPALAGAVNVVAPDAVRNLEFTKALGRALGRPTILPVPSAALKLALGEFAEAVLGSQRVVPRKLIESGYWHQLPMLDAALAATLGGAAR